MNGWARTPDDFRIIKSVVNSIPTAYDVEKVVEELEQREESSVQCYVEAMTEGSCGSASRFCGERYAWRVGIDKLKFDTL